MARLAAEGGDHLSRAGDHIVVLAVVVGVGAIVGLVFWLVQRARSRSTGRRVDRDPES